jgi:hypothetical protein
MTVINERGMRSNQRYGLYSLSPWGGKREDENKERRRKKERRRRNKKRDGRTCS